MVILACLVLFLAVTATAPTGVEWLERRRVIRDAVSARILYLPSGRCRGSTGYVEWLRSEYGVE